MTLTSKESVSTLHNDILKIQSEILQAISENKHDEIDGKFNLLLEKFILIGSYNKITWPIKQTKKWWDFFSKISEYEQATHFISLIDDKIPACTPSQIEPLEFVRLELLWGITKESENLEPIATAYTKKYPFNIEFLHTSAHILVREKNTIFEAVRLYRKCIESWGNDNKELKGNVYNYEVSIFRDTLEETDYLNAEKQLDYIISFEPYKNTPAFNNASLMHKERLRDRKFTEAKTKQLEREIRDSIRAELEVQSKKNIEQLSFFCAVITFIITIAMSAFNMDNKTSPIVALSTGIFTFLLVTAFSMYNFPSKTILKDYRAYILLTYTIMLISLCRFVIS
ncbi:hypothetical protein [Aeromonas caviae]|uniref:hypothetical protein n=1 Tax=Aeromonas caviae TaxID=648 RepID=UPI002251B401|nr:hypothetical protein [Aeromonas caviae]MCX4073576.1 hypothetical protein [Aeromonas caviae]